MKMPDPIPMQVGERQVQLIYCGVSRNMKELKPYFSCEAYGGNNSVYVLAGNGIKLFSDSDDELLKGHNLYTVLEKMEYLHGSSFDETRQELGEHRIAYSNAVKHTSNGGEIVFDITELPCGQNEYAEFCFSVTDTGYGMKPEFLEHIFEPFTRAENSVTNKIQGTGLGMAITKNIVDLMGGSIHVESEYGKGSCFDVILKFKIDNERSYDLKGEKILLISEDQVLTKNIQAPLRLTKLAFSLVSTEEEAVQFLKKEKVDVILMDIQMPHMNGYEATKAIHRSKNPLGSTIPIIAMTANAFSDDVQSSLAAGMNAHISKTIDMAVLEKTLRGIMSLKME